MSLSVILNEYRLGIGSVSLDVIRQLVIELEAAPLWNKAPLASELGQAVLAWAETIEGRLQLLEGKKNGRVSTEATGGLRAVP